MKTLTVRSVILAAATLFCVSALQAQSQPRPPLYIDVSAVANSTTWDNVKIGYGAGVAFGVIVKERNYIEAELMYLKNDMDDEKIDGFVVSGDLQQMLILATYRYDIPLGTNTKWSLQVGGSVGGSNQKVTAKFMGLSASESKWAAALGAQAKAVYNINETTSVNAGLRAIWTAETDLNDEAGTNMMLTVGVNFRF